MENAKNEIKKVYEMQVSFLEAIRDHGLEKTLETIAKADPTILGSEALGTVWVTLLTLYLPELLNDTDFHRIIASIMEENNDISERINPVIDKMKEAINEI